MEVDVFPFLPTFFTGTFSEEEAIENIDLCKGCPKGKWSNEPGAEVKRFITVLRVSTKRLILHLQVEQLSD